MCNLSETIFFMDSRISVPYNPYNVQCAVFWKLFCSWFLRFPSRTTRTMCNVHFFGNYCILFLDFMISLPYKPVQCAMCSFSETILFWDFTISIPYIRTMCNMCCFSDAIIFLDFASSPVPYLTLIHYSLYPTMHYRTPIQKMNWENMKTN